MAFALMIWEQRGQREARTEAQGKELYDRMLNFSAELAARGLLSVSQSLTSDRTGACVRVRESATSVVDGPFAEAKEMIGGFLLLTCSSRDEAIGIAKQCPAARWATVEVRELGPCFT